MKISIKKEVFRKFPSLQLGFILIENFDNKKKVVEAGHLVNDMANLIRLTFHPETLKNHYLISPWNVAQAEFGKEAKHYQTSVEILLKKVLGHKSVTEKNTLINLSHYLALKHIVPGSVDDYFKLLGNVEFKLASGKEKVGILTKLKKGALYYQDDNGVLGTKLDFWKNKRTLVRADTTKALVHFAALLPIDRKKLNEILKEGKEIIHSFCGGKMKVFILDKKKNEVRI